MGWRDRFHTYLRENLVEVTEDPRTKDWRIHIKSPWGYILKYGLPMAIFFWAVVWALSLRHTA